MADDRWRDDERRNWDEDRNRYGGQGYGQVGAYGQGVYGQGRPRPYYERPESQSDYDRLGYGQDQSRRYGEGGYKQQGQGGGGWYSGDGDRSRGRYGDDWPSGTGEGWAGGGYGGGYLGGGSSYGGYGGQGWRGYGEGWAGGRQEGVRGRGREQDRSWFDRAADEVSSWMGDEEAERRRRMDQARSGHYGKGPRGYTRSDDRIREDVNDRLTDDWQIDASEIEVQVNNCEVTLAGTVRSREEKRRAEDLAENVSGVRHVQNNVRVQQGSGTALAGESAATAGASAKRSTR